MRFHMLQNAQMALDFLRYKKIKLVNIRAEDIVDGNPKLTLGLIWTIILHFQVSGCALVLFMNVRLRRETKLTPARENVMFTIVINECKLVNQILRQTVFVYTTPRLHGTQYVPTWFALRREFRLRGAESAKAPLLMAVLQHDHVPLHTITNWARAAFFS